jgi:hypothetical protein
MAITQRCNSHRRHPSAPMTASNSSHGARRDPMEDTEIAIRPAKHCSGLLSRSNFRTAKT